MLLCVGFSLSLSVSVCVCVCVCVCVYMRVERVDVIAVVLYGDKHNNKIDVILIPYKVLKENSTTITLMLTQELSCHDNDNDDADNSNYKTNVSFRHICNKVYNSLISVT